MAEQAPAPQQEQPKPQPQRPAPGQRPARRGMTEEQIKATQIAAEQKRAQMETEKVLVWPDLVYAEFMSAIFLTIVLFVISLVFNAPLEEPSNPNKTPIPSRAPWYFLGLQEMLVYFDPWIAGVLLPGMIIVGLMLIPYVDTKPNVGIGRFSWKGREWQYIFFIGGFALWIGLIIVGQFFRWGPWAIYMPWEPREHVKVVAEHLWWCPAHKTTPSPMFCLPGFLIYSVYNLLMFTYPAWLRFVHKGLGERALNYYRQLGLVRFIIVMVFVSWTLFLPVKMAMRLGFFPFPGLWGVKLKYLVVTPWFNI